MPAMQNLAANDRQTVPVTHTYIPHSIDPKTGIARLVEVGSVPFGEPSITLTLTKNLSTGKMRGRMVHRIPIVQNETINGITTPRVVRESVIDFSFTSSLYSSEGERNDHIGIFVNALATTKVITNDLFVKGQGIY